MARLRRPLVTLELPESVPAIIIFARSVNSLMDPNPYFTGMDPTTADFAAHIDTLAEAESAVLHRGKGQAAERDVVLQVVLDDLERRRAVVQKAVRANPAEAEAIVSAVGMHIKRYKRAPKPPLEVTMTGFPDRVLVRAKSKGKGTAYEWEYSLDGVTWASFGLTTVADTTLSGLEEGKVYYFRVRTTRKRTTGDWSPIVRFMVH